MVAGFGSPGPKRVEDGQPRPLAAGRGLPSMPMRIRASMPLGRMLRPLRGLQYVAAFLLLFYVGLLLTFSNTQFPVSMHSSSHWPFMMDKPVGEDGFYMLTVADNIATKGHIEYNRGIPATGIQPMATFVFAALDLMVHKLPNSPLDLIRATLMLGVILFLLFAVQMSAIARQIAPANCRSLAGVLTLLLVMGDFTLFRLFTYGLETGFYLLCLAACFHVTLRIAHRGEASLGMALLLGLTAGLAGEARIDFGVVFAVVLVGMVWKKWITPGRALMAGAVALAIVSPWFLYLHQVSGSWMPSSAGAESSPLAGDNLGRRFLYMLAAVAGNLAPWVYAIESKPTVIAGTVSMLVLGILLWRRRLTFSLMPEVAPMVSLWAISVAILTVIYFVTFDSSHFYYRYTAPIVVLSIPVLASMLSRLTFLKQHMYAFAAFLFVCFSGWAFSSLHTGRIGNGQAIVAGYVQKNFPSAHVGSFQSGVVGFFNRNVENLDGKLNGPALEATKRHALPQFLDQQHIDVIIDWPSVIHAALPADYLAEEWQACPVPLQGTEAICLSRKKSARPDNLLKAN